MIDVVQEEKTGTRAMCRNIKRLYNTHPLADEADIRAAAEQFVRKVSGFRKPSKINEPAYNQAVDDIAKTVTQLLDKLQTKALPKKQANSTPLNS